jgi:hypothetical protein
MTHDPREIYTKKTWPQKSWPDSLLSQALGALPARVPPAGLTTSLRVIASRERQRHLRSRDAAAVYAAWRERMDLFCCNLMRPLALPFAGGVFCAVVLFSMLVVPTYPVRASSSFDVPTMLTTEATVKGMGPIRIADDTVVEVTIDGQGRMVDYTIVSGHCILKSESLRRSLENALLFAEFTPATAFGQPTSGKMRLSLRASHIDVKG